MACCSESDEGAGDDCFTLPAAAVAIFVAAAADVVAASSDAVDKCAVDFSNLLNGFCILNDTFVGNLEELFDALEALLAFVVLVMFLLDSSIVVVAAAADLLMVIVGGGGVAGLTNDNEPNGLISTSIIDASKCDVALEAAATGSEGRGPGSSI